MCVFHLHSVRLLSDSLLLLRFLSQALALINMNVSAQKHAVDMHDAHRDLHAESFSAAQLKKCAGGQKFTLRSCADIPAGAAHWPVGAASHLSSNCSFLGNSRSVRCVGGLLGETTSRNVQMTVCATCVVFECNDDKENYILFNSFSSLAQAVAICKMSLSTSSYGRP